jgi:predicted nucleic acid-binding protein
MAAANICLDTDILIDHLRNQPRTAACIEELETEGAILCTTTINAFELFYGAHKTAKKESNVRATKALLERLVLFDFNAHASELAGEILAALELGGESIGFRDLFIGATALVNNAQLLTRNIKHFQKVPGLQLRALH